MPGRLRLFDIRLAWPQVAETLGICQDDIASIARYVNQSQRRLLYCKEAGDQGWYGTWAEIAFTVSQTTPYWTAPREIARLEYANVCEHTIRVHNQFLEYLDFGDGRMPKTWESCHHTGQLAAYTRNNVPTFIAMTSPPQYIAVYLTNSDDTDKRVLIQGTDSTDTVVTFQDARARVQGVYASLESPFTMVQDSTNTTISWNSITGIQKDLTVGPVQIYQVDPTTGAQVLLLTMEPGETVASYRRYYFHKLPPSCCPGPTTVGPVQVTGLVKLDLIPVVVDTDYCLLQCLEAILEECQAIRYSKIDTVSAKQMAQEKHMQAVRYLNGEIKHFLGERTPSVVFAPFGSAHLRHKRIGSLL